MPQSLAYAHYWSAVHLDYGEDASCCMFFFCLQINTILFLFVKYFCCVRGFVSLLLGQEIGWKERLRNDPFCVEWDVKTKSA